MRKKKQQQQASKNTYRLKYVPIDIQRNVETQKKKKLTRKI